MSKCSSTARVLRPGAMPERELDVLVAIYQRAIERYEEAKAAETDGGNDDVRKDQDAHTTMPSIPQ